MTDTFADITSVDPPLRQALLHQALTEADPPRDGQWFDELFRQRDEAIEARDVFARRVAELGLENGRLRARLQQIAELHTDSVAGVCPSCGRIGEQSDTDDGLVPWPCPTVQLADPRTRLIEAGAG